MLDIQRQVGERIRHLRRLRGFTQEELADASGLNRAHLGEIERGEVDVTIVTLQRIGRGLRLRVSSLVKDIGVPRK